MTSENMQLYATLLGSFGLAFWTFLKGTDWWQEHVVKRRFDKAIDAVAVGVQTTYNDFARERKATGQKLVPEDAAQARRMAGEIARAYAAKEGPKVLKILTDEFLRVWIERKVKESKQ